MFRLDVSIEIKGKQIRVGEITGNDHNDARFRYSEDYLNKRDSLPISISLPLRPDAYSPENTRVFFEGLLPEGYTRKTLSESMSINEDDYISLLSKLGKECLGAVKISETDEVPVSSYEKLSLQDVKELAGEGVTKSVKLITRSRMSLTGASGKVGLYYDAKKDAWYLPTGYAASTHIVKQSHVRLEGIVTNEQLIMMTAKKLGIDIPESFIINAGDGKDADVLFATERFDRFFCDSCVNVSGLLCPCRLHQEDFGQALGIPSSLKYENDASDIYMKKMFEILANHSSDPIRDRAELWKRIVFNVLAGNTDCHVKNFALLYSNDLKNIKLAPAYDMLSTVIYKDIAGKMAFNIGGEYDIEKIGETQFAIAAEEARLGKEIALDIYREISEKFVDALDEAAAGLCSLGFNKAIEIRDDILRIHRKWSRK